MNVSRFLLPLGLSLVAGCSPSSDIVGAGGGNDVATGAGNGQTGTGTNNGGTFAGNGTQASTGSTNTCAATSFEAEAVPLTLFIAFDKSGSMGENNKWNDASTALKGFIQDPSTAGIEVALRFFPLGGCNEGQCDISACSTPDVDVGALTAESAPADVQEQELVTKIDLVSPSGGTPMSAAMEGAKNWASDYRVMHPEKKIAIILVTDGIPMGCGGINDVANTAAEALGNSEITTYAVGLQGSQEGDMNQVAQAGGSMQAYFIGNGNAEQDLLLALQDIRGKSIACELTLPEPTNGEELDPSQVNIVFTPTGSQPQTLGNVPNEAACAGQAWYYDDPADPTTIKLCPEACTLVSGDTTGKLDIQLGCATIPK